MQCSTEINHPKATGSKHPKATVINMRAPNKTKVVAPFSTDLRKGNG
jgi:hypothetical protein